MLRPSLRSLASLYLRIGNLTFGGGDPTMAALQRELVDQRRWLSPEQFGVAYSVARITPGTNVLAFCAASGWMLLRWVGAVAAVMGASVPSAVLAVWLLYAYQSWQRHPLVSAAVWGMIAAVAGIMAASVLLLVRPRVRDGGPLRAILLTGGSFLLAYRFSASPLAILAAAALAGYFWKEPVRR